MLNGLNRKKCSFSLTVHRFCIIEIWHLGKHLVIIRPYEYNVDLPRVKSFHLVPHLSRLAIWQHQKLCQTDRQTDRHIYTDIIKAFYADDQMHMNVWTFFVNFLKLFKLRNALKFLQCLFGSSYWIFWI